MDNEIINKYERNINKKEELIKKLDGLISNPDIKRVVTWYHIQQMWPLEKIPEKDAHSREFAYKTQLYLIDNFEKTNSLIYAVKSISTIYSSNLTTRLRNNYLNMNIDLKREFYAEKGSKIAEDMKLDQRSPVYALMGWN